ncbi:MAG: NAD(P)/FAD-dependent oxidoreductase [Thermoplasmata archaeon]|nr:NAD(P)/FAD-dependent oxidoreductase [Thermoplasmata archaeon]
MAGFPKLAPEYEIVVVGGGHAGLQAGLKAALLEHTAVVLSRGPKYGRSYYAPRMDNIPGFPDAISGHNLLDLQVRALARWPEKVAYITPARVLSARRGAEGFEVELEWLARRHTVRGKALILAMGVVDRIPVVGGSIKPIFPWANLAIVDFCVFCDGHDLPGRSVGVLGDDAFAAHVALDLRHFKPSSLELLTNGRPFLEASTPEERSTLLAELEGAKIGVHSGEIVGFDGIREKRWTVKFADGSERSYDRGFSGLGWYTMNDEIPRSLGARFDPEGYVMTDSDSRVLSAESGAPIPGLYCVGDLASGWNQIPEAWATAERAVIHAYAEYL